jgi:hypothetical protein
MNQNNHAAEATITYLVYAPEYVYWSAGIKILYKLHDAIKETGREVYLLNHGRSPLKQKWKTSRLVSKLNRESETRIFVAIYTESIIGNPLKVKNRIRWILNYPGLLGGQAEFEQDYILPYSHNIAKRMMRPGDAMPDSLFIAALSVNEIANLKPMTEDLSERPYELLYAQKYRALGGIPLSSSDSTIEITRFDRKAPSREETLNLVRGARALHVYENSTIITEAQLCEVPVFCHRNEYFDELIAETELGNEGISWNLLEYPKVDSLAVRSRLIELESSLLSRVDICFSRFEIQKLMTQNGEGITFGAFSGPLKHRIQRFSSITTNRGARTALRFLFNFLKRSIFPNPWNRKLNRLD